MNSRPRLVVFVIMIMALSALSFHGALDSFASEKVKATTTETVGIYAVAKGINAAVSVIQSAQFGPVVASVKPGQILDPLNDAIERLSGIAVWAIGSLFLQQIVLDVAESSVFKWLFGAVGLLTLCALLPLGSARVSGRACRVSGMSEEMLDRSCMGVVRIFVVLAVLRFIVPVFIACSFLVSEMLVQSHLEQNKNELAVLENELAVNQDTASPESAGLVAEKKDSVKELAVLQKTEVDYQKQYDDVITEIKALKEKAGFRRFVPERLGGKAPGPEVDTLKAEQEDLERKLEDIKRQIDEKNSELDCLDRKIEGKRCGSVLERLNLKDRFTGLTDRASKLKEIPGRLADSMNDYLISIAKMLIVLLIKNILFPLLFLYIAMKCGISIIRRATPMVRSGLDTKREFQEAGKKLLGT